MRVKVMMRIAGTLALVLCAALVRPAAAARPIAESDLFKFVWIADPQMSPDGSQIVFVRVAIDARQEGYETALWLAKADGSAPPRRLSGGTRDSAPRWSPEGRRIAFVRAAQQDGRPQTPQLYVMTLDGGDARAITAMPTGAASPVWSPDGKTIAYLS